MKAAVDLRAHPTVLKALPKGFAPLALAMQRASQGRVGVTLNGVRVGDLQESAFAGIDAAKAHGVLSGLVEYPLRHGNYPLEVLLALNERELGAKQMLSELDRTHLPFIAEDVVKSIEARQLKVLMMGGAGSGVVSAVQDMVTALCSAGYNGRAFPLFDPSKKGAPVEGYGVSSKSPILSHAPFERPDIVLLFDPKLLPRLRTYLSKLKDADPEDIAITVNTSMNPAAFRTEAGLLDPYHLYTLDASGMLRGKRIPPNYAMIGAMLGILGKDAVDADAFEEVVRASLTEKFGKGEKVDVNIDVLRQARTLVRGEEGRVYTRGQDSLGSVSKIEAPESQVVLCEDGNRAIARAMEMVLNLNPAVVAAYPITPQTQIVEHLAQREADGALSAVMVTPESEHGAGGAVMGAARDRALVFTATCSQGAALMSENLHSMSGMRMGNVVVSNVVRSLNSPLDVENDHADLYKVLLDAGFITLMSRDVQQAHDLHVMAYLVSMYAEYRERKDGALEMIPDRTVMLPAVVASEGFEVSHAPERYVALKPELVQRIYDDPAFAYIKTFVQPGKIVGINEAIMGALQLSNSRLDTDFQRHQAMQVAYEGLKMVFGKFEEYTGRKYDFVHSFNVEESDVVFVVAGAANGTFEEVAREFKNRGINVGVVHPNVLRPFPKNEWAGILKGKKVFVYDRDDPFGASAGRLASELGWLVNEFGLAGSGAQVFSAIYGLGGRTPSLSLVRDEIYKALRHLRGEIEISPEKRYVGVRV